ncbi:unnamed protein product [Dovyalis caffra]|uniref:protoporphyrin ferrochelatase n=1 Tax=Dovyalis caffra TaxID=77055 RepID=A0AAV1R7S9_9ROSI|nr:unnamed protein product [Dovyalis caffra]
MVGPLLPSCKSIVFKLLVIRGNIVTTCHKSLIVNVSLHFEFQNKQMAAELVHSATSDKLAEVDWTKNIEICELVARDERYNMLSADVSVSANALFMTLHRQARDIVKAIKKRLGSKNANTQLYAVMLLEMLMNNIGEKVHRQVIDTGILPILVKIVKKKTELPVRERIFLLLDATQTSLGGASGKFPQYYSAYYDLVSAGVQFAQRPRERPSNHQAAQENNKITLNGELAASRREAVAQPAPVEPEVVPESSIIQKASNALEVLKEVLDAVDSQNPEGAKDEFTLDLVEQCSFQKQRVMHLVMTSRDEKLVSRAIELNEQLQKVLARHDALLSGRSTVPYRTRISHRTTTTTNHFNHEESEEEEPEQLFRRLRKGKACARPEDEGNSEEHHPLPLGLLGSTIPGERLNRPLIRPLPHEPSANPAPVVIPPPPAKHMEREKFFQEKKADGSALSGHMRDLSLDSHNASSSRSGSIDFSISGYRKVTDAELVMLFSFEYAFIEVFTLFLKNSALSFALLSKLGLFFLSWKGFGQKMKEAIVLYPAGSSHQMISMVELAKLILLHLPNISITILVGITRGNSEPPIKQKLNGVVLAEEMKLTPMPILTEDGKEGLVSSEEVERKVRELIGLEGKRFRERSSEMKTMATAAWTNDNQMMMNCGAMTATTPSSTSWSASHNSKLPMLLPRANCTTRRMCCVSGVHVDACVSSNVSRNYVVAKDSLGWSGTSPSLYSKQPINRFSLPLRALVTSTPQDVPTASLIGDEKVGVLLLNLGGPETLEDVQPFLFNLFADPAEELRKSLWEKQVPAKVYVGMRYWHPFTEEAIEQIKRDGITKLVVLPLYPQFSISTSGSSLRLLESIFREDEYLVNMQHTVIPSWYQREGYIKAMANLIEKELQKFDRPEQVVIFFSAHGVPLAYVEEAGDPYKAEMEECVDLIMEELENRKIINSYTLAYQSRVGPVEWLKPYTDETIIELGKKGVKHLLAVPISFVSEHIETLEEIDVEYKELALKSGIEKWGRVPALGCEPTFISDLADAVIESLPYVGAMAVSNLEARQCRGATSSIRFETKGATTTCDGMGMGLDKKCRNLERTSSYAGSSRSIGSRSHYRAGVFAPMGHIAITLNNSAQDLSLPLSNEICQV